MKKILFMTVGTGIGNNAQARTQSLAHGILKSILHYNPEKIVFFGSEKSKKTITSLKKQYKEVNGKELKDSRYEFVLLDQIDEFNHCFSKIREKIRSFQSNMSLQSQSNGDQNHEIIIDYTSGTKTMTMSAAIASVLYQKKLSLISGTRGDHGIVIQGTERIVEQNLYKVFDQMLLERLKGYFNEYQFINAVRTIDDIISLGAEEKECWKNLIQGFLAWDQFNHSKAEKLLIGLPREFIHEFTHLEDQVNKNKQFIARINKDENEEHLPLTLFYISDLLNNVNRRIEEGKIDDATARLYRIMELIAQHRLITDFGIDTSDVDLTLLKEHNIGDELMTRLSNIANDKYDKKIKIGLFRDYELLDALGDALGEKFSSDKKVQQLLTRRNSSILAHGIEPMDRESTKGLQSKVMEYAYALDEKNIRRLCDLAKFPEFRFQ